MAIDVFYVLMNEMRCIHRGAKRNGSAVNQVLLRCIVGQIGKDWLPIISRPFQSGAVTTITIR